jgi:hypothetical protein
MHELSVWDAASGRERVKLTQGGLQARGQLIHTTRVQSLALTPDGRRLVSGLFSTAVREPVLVWEVASGTVMSRLAGHDHGTLALAVSPDSRVVASGGADHAVRLWELATGRELRKLEGHQGPVLAVAFSADGRRLLSGSRDTTALVWDLSGVLPQEQAAPLRAAESKELWAELALEDGARAYRAVRRLARAPDQALPHIRTFLGKQSAVDAARLARLVADLDADEFDRREAASAELARLGRLVESALRRALEDRPSPELRKRAEALLGKLGDRPGHLELQAVRAVEVLELIGTPEARQVIESLARGAASAWVDEEARAALDRLARREGGR